MAVRQEAAVVARPARLTVESLPRAASSVALAMCSEPESGVKSRPSATDSETTNVTTAAARTEVSAPILDIRCGRTDAWASRVLTALADASAAPRASAMSASAAEMTGEDAISARHDTIRSMSSEPTTKMASGRQSLRSNIAITPSSVRRRPLGRVAGQGALPLLPWR